ncbi:replication factor C subunit 1 [Culicoides brevitarsis]|uniref:replication factor C subunit 1 n=1 Tax=Culicoides brevitarsis TaxID=469753 RepID=UPI00307B33BF
MSRDIRSYFSMGAAKKPKAPVDSPLKRKSVIALSDSDDDGKPKEQQKKASHHTKKRRVVDSDDEEEEKKASKKEVKPKKEEKKQEKLKEVDPAAFFGNKEPLRVEKTVIPSSKKKKKDDLFASDDEAELSMMDLDVSVAESPSKKKKENKTPPKKETPKKESSKKETPKKEKEVKTEKLTPKKEEKPVKKEKSSPKVVKEEPKEEKPSTSKTPKGTPKTATKRKKPENEDEPVITDEERHQRKVQAAILFRERQKHGGPTAHGSKEIPEGKPNCLAGMAFIITGELESQTREEAADLIKSLGGRMMTTVSKKLSYMVVGELAGPAKIAKADEYGIPQINEDELLDLIREKSGIPKKNPVKEEPKESPAKKIKKEESPKKVKKEEETKIPIKKEPEPSSSSSNIPKPPSKIDENSIAWVDKYKPTNIKQIIGQQGPQSNCQKLINWLQKWDSNNDGKKKHARPNPWAKNDDGASFKAVLLSGPPGVGKTTTAHLVCKELGYDIVEFNASDTRSKRLLQEEVATLLSNKSLNAYVHGTSKSASAKRVLIMDEVDGIGGNEDRGGAQELIQLIKTTHIPIICMCNDRNHQKMKTLVNYCFDLRFSKPRVEQIRGAMMSVLFKEGMKIPKECLDEIISGTGNDVRQTLNHLAMYSASKDINASKESGDYKKEAKTAEKDVKIGPFDVARKVFDANEHKGLSLDDKLSFFFHDYNMASLFVQENYLTVQPNAPKKTQMQLFAEVADSLSRGDMIEKRIRTDSAWSLLPVQGMYCSVIPGELLEGSIGRINFPGWLGKNSKTMKRKRLAQEIHDHTRTCTSGSRLSIRLDYAQFLTKAIVDPLKQKGMDGVPETLEVMKAYKLLREDIDSLVELSTWPKQKNPMDGIESKVKAALTRTYNKEVLPYSFSALQNVKKKKVEVSEEYEGIGGDEEGLQDASGSEDEDDKLENNAFIKVKKPSAPKAAKAGTSKEPKASSSKGKKK